MATVVHHAHSERSIPRRRIEVNFTSPRAKEVAEELFFTDEILHDMVGTGVDGAITVSDLRNWAKED